MKVLRWETILGTNNSAIISYYHLEIVLLKILYNLALHLKEDILLSRLEVIYNFESSAHVTVDVVSCHRWKGRGGSRVARDSGGGRFVKKCFRMQKLYVLYPSKLS